MPTQRKRPKSPQRQPNGLIFKAGGKKVVVPFEVIRRNK